MQNENYTNPTPLGPIPSDWNIMKVESLCQNVTTGGTPSRSNPAYFSNGSIKWVKTQELKDCFIDDTLEKITPEAIQDSAAKIFPKNTVLMAMYGEGVTITGLGILNTEAATNQACCAMIVNPDVCDFRFLFYALKYHRRDFLQLATGGAQRNLSGKIIRSFAIKVPPLPNQHAIAHILGSLDDKIELNRQMNETLEAMARAIFRSWFVDFDPVRAKAEGRDTGLPPEVAALFPDGFDAVDGREVPKGWKISKVGDELTTLLGGTPSRDVADYWQNGTIPWINSGKANEFRIIDPSEYITKSGLECSATKLLPERTTIIAITGATLGQVSLLEISTCANQSIVGVVGNEKLPNEFVYMWIKNNIDELVSRQTGGAQQHINKNDVNDLEILIPDPMTLQNFMQQVRPFFDIIKNNCMGSRTLAEIRDALLPKLMSGEIKVDGFSS